MKKLMIAICAILACFCFAAGAFARNLDLDGAFGPSNIALSVGNKPLGLLSVSADVTPSRGDLLRFIPTIIHVTSSQVKVEGYFINLNTDCSVKNFTEFEMEVYHDGKFIVSGTFGTINEFTVPALGMVYQSFTFNGSHQNISNGDYSTGDYFYCALACRFTAVTR